MERKNNFTLALIFVIFLIGIVSADVSYNLQYDEANINYGVITKSFDLVVLNSAQENLEVSSGDLVNLLSRSNGVDTYNWTIGSTSGIRTFTLGGETFTIEVKSEIDELFDSVDYITVYINQDSSKIIINELDIDGTTNEYFDFDYDEFSGRFSWQNILNGIDLNFTFPENANYPLYNSLSLSGTAETIIDNIIDYNSASLSYGTIGAIEANHTLLNELIDIYGLTGDYSANVNVYKQDNFYQFDVNKGYGIFNDSSLDTIRDIISDGINLVNPSNVSHYLNPYFDLSDYLGYVTWTTNADMSEVLLEDGSYSIPFTLTDEYDNEAYYTVTLVLDIESNEEVVVENNTYVPTNEEVLEYIQEITGLPDGAELTVAVFGNNLPATFTATASETPAEIEESINYIELTLNQSSTGGNFKVNFTVPNTFNKDKIQAYVYEVNSWVKLPTRYIKTQNGKHYFQFTVTHFSEFLIAENKEAPTSPGSGSNTCSTDWECTSWSSCVRGAQTRICTKESASCTPRIDKPLESKICSLARAAENLENNPGIINAQESGKEKTKGVFSRMTGAVIGTLGPGGSLFVLLLLLTAIVLTLILIRLRRQKIKENEEEKRKEEEEKIKEAEAKIIAEKTKSKKTKKKAKRKSVSGKSQSKKVDKRKKAKEKRKAKPKKKKPVKKTSSKKKTKSKK